MSSPSRRRPLVAGLVATLVALAAPAPAHAQGPTPEGTVITNTAVASWTDANGNSYSPASASASITVGYLPGLDVTAPAAVTPASPSTGNEIAFVLNNQGNGTDQFSVAVTAGAGVTVAGYRLSGQTHATLGALNAALAATNVVAGASITVDIVYTVAPGQGGEDITLSLTATSVRTAGEDDEASDVATVTISPSLNSGVDVSVGGGTALRLPSNGTSYTESFTVENQGNSSDTYTLLGGGTDFLTIISVNGTAGTGASVTVPAGGSVGISVVYTVGDAPAGATAPLSLRATSGNDGLVTDIASRTVGVVRPTIILSKQVFRDDQTTELGGGDTVLPGEYVWYRLTATNAGAVPASSVELGDPLPEELDYSSSAADAAGWTISASGNSVTATLSGTLAPSESRHIWIRARVR